MLPIKALYKVISEFVPDFKSNYTSCYETRLQAQKAVYLFTQLINDDSYGFSWYIAGPYSACLTHQLYNELFADDTNTSEWDKLVFTPAAQEILQKLREMLEESTAQNGDLDATKRLELLGSIWYIAANSRAIDGTNKIAVVKEKLILNKPHFRDTENLDEIINLVLCNIESNKEALTNG
ncbi:MAG: hypothetical protein EOM51_05965 [Clostridia bacterium]|nr:hypothetical protein [Clostridia bacterium]